MAMYSDEQREFLRACASCESDAFDFGIKLFVERRLGAGFVISGVASEDVLFTAYPDGRKIISAAGQKILEDVLGA